jgi:Na+/H+-translocating membrane pyrophosphatase
LLFIFKDRPTAIGFVIGAFCSLSAGYVGMRIAVIANVRTTQAATVSITKALRMAFNGGAVTGLLVVGLALLAVSIFYTVVSRFVGPQMAINSLVGLALGASLISVFARLGGVFTPAADVGADLVGKIEKGLEDDPRNPPQSRTTSATTLAIAPAWPPMSLKHTRSVDRCDLAGAFTLPGNPAVVVPLCSRNFRAGAILGVLL